MRPEMVPLDTRPLGATGERLREACYLFAADAASSCYVISGDIATRLSRSVSEVRRCLKGRGVRAVVPPLDVRAAIERRYERMARVAEGRAYAVTIRADRLLAAARAVSESGLVRVALVPAEGDAGPGRALVLSEVGYPHEAGGTLDTVIVPGSAEAEVDAAGAPARKGGWRV